MAGRCTNKEIAAALYLSEGTVKQYINQLYAKLDMGGDPRTRRARLAEWYQKNAPRNEPKTNPGLIAKIKAPRYPKSEPWSFFPATKLVERRRLLQ